MSSLPKQETSYWPLMHDPRNILEWPHGRFLFSFALPTPTTPGTPPSWSLSGLYIPAHRGICHFHHLRIPGRNPFLLCRLGYFD
jgi:hypothetical protein